MLPGAKRYKAASGSSGAHEPMLITGKLCSARPLHAVLLAAALPVVTCYADLSTTIQAA